MSLNPFTLFEHVVTTSSLIYLLLPSIETFKDYPKFQKAYGVFVAIIVKWASLNIRNVLYSSKFNPANLPPQEPNSKENTQ